MPIVDSEKNKESSVVLWKVWDQNHTHTRHILSKCSTPTFVLYVPSQNQNTPQFLFMGFSGNKKSKRKKVK